MPSLVIIGGGPGGVDAALAARQLGADVTLIERGALGGSAVLMDVVPSKSLISAGQVVGRISEAQSLGIRLKNGGKNLWDGLEIDFRTVTTGIRNLAAAQSRDTTESLRAAGVHVVAGHGRLDGPRRVVAETAEGELTFDPDVVLLAVGGHPRVLDTARPDGERILGWQQIYDMTELPEHLIVVGSGVTGAEFSSAFRSFGSQVTLVSSRDQILPGQDADAAAVIAKVFADRGIEVLNNAHAESVTRDGDGVVVALADGQQVHGSHCVVAVGAIPNTAGLGLEAAGVEMRRSGHIRVDEVSRTSVRGVYASGDCTDGMKLASVASMQGKIAVWHALGDAVAPLNLRTVAAGIYTTPEVAAVGIGEADVQAGVVRARSVTVPLATNARTKMKDFDGGFIKLFALPVSHIVVGGVIVSLYATELIHSISLAVACRLTVEQVAEAFTVYPSLSGSIAEAATRLRGHEESELVLP